MNLFIKLSLLVGCTLITSSFLIAQVFYSEDFSDQSAAETNWISGGSNTGMTTWTWSDDPGFPAINQLPPFASATATNGFFIFDSDLNGQNTHQVTLTGPAIDCSNQSVVFASFQNQFAIFSPASTADLGVSTDGINFNYYPILENTAADDLAVMVQNEAVDITTDAAGQPTVYLQFRWTGSFEYVWKIDDLVLTSVDPNPYDLLINEVQYPPNFLQPSSQLDIVMFNMEIHNNGSMTQTNIKGKAEIFLDNTLIFADSVSIERLDPNATELLEFPITWIQEGTGEHTIKYSVSGDQPDTYPSDNSRSRTFVLAPNVFSKDDGNSNSLSIQPPGVNSIWETGNIYHVVNEGFYAEIVYFSATSSEPLEGKKVDIKLYQITEDNNPNFTNADVTLIATSEHVFTTETNFAIVAETFDDGPVPLLANTDYLVMIAYPPELSAPYSPIEYPFQITSIVKTNNAWFLHREDVTIVARLQLTNEVATKEIQLNDNNKIAVYPNPVLETLTLDIDLEENANLSKISIFDVSGKLMYKNVLENIQTKKMGIDISQYVTGAYMLHFTTEHGVKTKRFVVAK